MSITPMHRAALALLIALSLGACAATDPPQDASDETIEALTALEDRLTELETDLRADIEAESDDRSRLGERLEALSDKLERSLERLREALEGAKAGSAEARDAAASALANAQSALSDLNVLEERYDYHLRRYHGGGG